MRERYGIYPKDFQEFAILLERRFGSSTRVDRARATLCDIRQGQIETTRAYSTRFEALLGKLPSFDQYWAKTQFVWGLHSCVTKLGTVVGPADLHLAIFKVEEIDGPEPCLRRPHRTENAESVFRQRPVPKGPGTFQCNAN